MSLDGKLASIDRRDDQTKTFLLAFIDEWWDELLLLAKGRLVRGHFEYEDRNYKEWGPERLLAELAEEIADAINYAAERFNKLDG